MSDSTLQRQIEAAKAYEALFVAALFEPWAPRVAQAAGIRPGQRVLDVACGTGVLARTVWAMTGAAGHVVGLDPNPGMLTVAKELEPRVDWRCGVAESMPFSDASFDAVVSQFGLLFFEDRDQALREMLRVLSRQGRLAVAVWDELANVPAYAAEVSLLEGMAGSEAANALRAPFVLGEREGLAKIVRNAGAASVQMKTLEGLATFPSIRVMIEADLRGWLPVMGVVLSEQQIADILDKSEEVFREYVRADGRVQFAIRAHLVTAARL